MNIALAIRDSLESPTGINFFLFNLADAFLRRGHRVLAIGTEQSRPSVINDLYKVPQLPEICSLSEARWIGVLKAAQLWRHQGQKVLKDFKADVVVFNGVVPSRMPCPSIAVSHDLEERNWDTRFARILYKAYCYRQVDRVIVTCSELRQALAKEIWLDEKTLGCIPTCLSDRGYQPAALEERSQSFLHIGTYMNKNPSASIAAFARVQHPDAELLIVGRVSPALQAEVDATAAGRAGRIRLLGVVSAEELRQLLCRARALLVPSVYTIPVASPTVLEGFAAGTPVVCSPSISRDLIADQTNCLIANSPDEVATKINLLAKEDGLWRQLSQEGLRTAARFSPERVADAYLCEFDKLRIG